MVMIRSSARVLIRYLSVRYGAAASMRRMARFAIGQVAQGQPRAGAGLQAWLPQPLLAVVPAPGTATHALRLRTQQAEDGAAPHARDEPADVRPERPAAALPGSHVQAVQAAAARQQV